MTAEALIQEARSIIDTLPQRHLIEDARVERWIEAVREVDGDRIVWHAKRLFGIGGSEIGHLVAAERDEFSFDSPFQVVAPKLMIQPPVDAGPDAERGDDLEDLVAAKFLKMVGGKRDEDALQAIREAPVDNRHPWQVGNPDDIVLIGGKRYLADYKVPRAGRALTYQATGVPFGYVCQLHHYGSIGFRQGVHFDGYILVPFDLDSWRPVPLEVPYDAQLNAEILRVGDLYWNEFVMKGQLPSFDDASRVSISAETLPPRLHELARKQVSHKVAADAHYSLAKEAQTAISHMAEELGFSAEDSTLLGVLKLSGKEQVSRDEAALKAAAEKLGLDLDAYEVERKYDIDAMFKAVKERVEADPQAEIDLEALERRSVVIDAQLTRKKKGPEAELLSAIRDKARANVELQVQEIFAMQEASMPLLPGQDSEAGFNAAPVAQKTPNPSLFQARSEAQPTKAATPMTSLPTKSPAPSVTKPALQGAPRRVAPAGGNVRALPTPQKKAASPATPIRQAPQKPAPAAPAKPAATATPSMPKPARRGPRL